MSDTNNLTGLDKAAILFQVFGESLALTMFHDLPESELLKIRVRSRELKNISIDIYLQYQWVLTVWYTEKNRYIFCFIFQIISNVINVYI